MSAKLLFSLLLCVLSGALSAQDTVAVALDTLPSPIAVDTLGAPITVDTLAGGKGLDVNISKDALDAEVTYKADTMRLDVRNQKILLLGNASVAYTNITLKAAYIEMNWAKTEVLAQGVPNDTTGQMQGLPEFTEGENTFNAGRMRYNFETRKGIVYEVVTTQDDIFVRGAKSKFISKAPNDSLAQDIIYSSDAIFTTCTHDEPHFGIRSQKQKVIPNKLIVIGPSNLEIMGVPTPVWLPFGFFPVSKGRRTGLIFPRDFEQSQGLGFGLKGVGWFFPLGDNYNLSLTGDYYLEGSFGFQSNLTYRKRYAYNGNLNLRYDNRRLEQVVDMIDPVTGETIKDENGQARQELAYPRQKGFSFIWSHTQDAGAHPLNRIGGSINFSTNNIQQQVLNDARTVNQNVTNSNFSFSRNWADKPISMSVAFNHSQNSRARTIDVNFPTFNFQTQSLYPFRIKERTGPKRWYEDITVRYTNEARATFSAPDTTFFDQATFDAAKYGMQHNATAGTSFKVLKYFNLNPGINYKEVWYMRSLAQDRSIVTGIEIDTTILADGSISVDTTDYGMYNVDTLNGFAAYRTMSANLSLTTQIFGTYRFKKGYIRGLRHVIKPSFSFGYQPDYLSNPNYFETVDLDPNIPSLFARLKDGIYGGPPQSEMQMAIGYNITNILEAKVFSRKDSTERNIKLFDNIYISGSYNFAADSLKWTPIAMAGNTRLFKGASNLTIRATFDPQAAVEPRPGTFTRIDQTVWSQSRRPFRFVDANVGLNTNLTIGKIRAIFQGEEEEVVENVDLLSGDNLRPSDETDFLSLFENFSIRHNLALGLEPLTLDKDTFQVTVHSIELRGSLGLTPNWNVDIGSIGYDFIRKQMTYPYLGLRRDLHCWEMGFDWAPTRNTYTFYLRVKPGTLDFIKVPYQRNNTDGPSTFSR